MKKNKPIVLITLLLALCGGIAYAASTGKIFCDSFEADGGTTCGLGSNEPPEDGPTGNLWDVMRWDQGKWG